MKIAMTLEPKELQLFKRMGNHCGQTSMCSHAVTRGHFEKHGLLMIIEGAGFKIKRVVEVDSRRRNAAPLKGQISKLTAKLIEADELVTVSK